MRFILVVSLVAALGACEKSATISLDYAKTSAGVYNAANYEVGQIFLWSPETGTVADLTRVAADITLTNNSGASRRASDVRGFVVGTNFEATAGQIAEIEIAAGSGTSVNYSKFVVEYSGDTRGAMSAFINSGQLDPEIWRLDEAITPGSGLYFVAISQTLLTEDAQVTTSATLQGGGKINVPSVDGGLNVSLADQSSISCEGQQRCFFEARVYEAFLNSRGNYDFKPATAPGATLRAFTSDLRKAS